MTEHKTHKGTEANSLQFNSFLYIVLVQFFPVSSVSQLPLKPQKGENYISVCVRGKAIEKVVKAATWLYD